IQAFAEACPVSGRLVIAGPDGEPGYGAYLKKCAAESGVAARIIFTGPLYNEEKMAAFAEANVFALPSRYENFANVAAESIACGVPVIVTPYCGIHTLVEAGPAGLIVAPEKQPLTEAIYRMIHDDRLVSRLRGGCRTVTERLSWDHLAAEMEKYYAEAMTGENGVQ
ncbi:MAG TPA: glycosyltransferase, partial [Candidatus Acidoferrum sp.]|nr:glycosyltransferase [Candidatus Acidoferrum sp.]